MKTQQPKAELCFRVLQAVRERWGGGDFGYITSVSEGQSLPNYFREVFKIVRNSADISRFEAIRDTDKLFILQNGLEALEEAGQLDPDEVTTARKIREMDSRTFPGFT